MTEHSSRPQKHVRIEYRVRPDVDLDGLKHEIAQFVAGIRAHSPLHSYTSFQDASDPRHFVHVGTFDAEVVPAMQQLPFFTHFTGVLRERAAVGPDVTMLTPVASTR